MGRITVYLYETAAGVAVVANRLGLLAKSSPATFAAIRSGVEMLEEFGPDPGLNKFKQLRHVEGGVVLWELRAQGKPAYRVLFAPVPGEEAYVLLLAVPKADMDRSPQRYIGQALDHLDHWLESRQRPGTETQ